MEFSLLGNSGVRVSKIALGCWSLTSDFNWGDQREDDSLAAIAAARDSGINFFDTAPGYSNGASEELLGRALQGWREEIVLASKAPPDSLTPAAMRKACEGSLKRLRTDYIDLYQIHWPNWDVPIAETIQGLDNLRKEGLIRAYGVCNFGPIDFDDFLASGRCLTNQLAYSLLARAIEYEIQPRCVREGISILCYSPLAQGLLTGKFRSADEVPASRARTRHFSKNRPHTRHGEDGCEQETFAVIERIGEICARIGEPMERVAIAWLLRRPAVASALAGSRSAEQVRSNALAADLQLTPEIVEELSAITDPIKERLGSNSDLWASDSRIR